MNNECNKFILNGERYAYQHTYLAWQMTGLSSHQVIGSGTILGTARFRFLLGEHFQFDTHSLHAYIIGEHGDSQVPVWSLANIRDPAGRVQPPEWEIS